MSSATTNSEEHGLERGVIDNDLEQIFQAPMDVLDMTVVGTPRGTVFSFPSEHSTIDRDGFVFPSLDSLDGGYSTSLEIQPLPDSVEMTMILTSPGTVFSLSSEDQPTEDVLEAQLPEGKAGVEGWWTTDSRSAFLFGVVLPPTLIVLAFWWFLRKARASRSSCALLRQRLEHGLRAELESEDASIWEGLVPERKRQVEQRRRYVDDLLDAGYKVGRCPWEARSKDLHRLDECIRGLRDRADTLERATEELKLMDQVEGAMYASASPPDGWREPVATVGSGGEERKEMESDVSPPHLLTKVRVLLSRETVVYRNDLEECCKRLEVEESKATDSLRYGLKTWDLGMIDKARWTLQTLGRIDLVVEGRQGREDVRSNLQELQEDLKRAYEAVAAQDQMSLLQEACVKAETFSGTSLPEYTAAKDAMGRLRAMKQEQQARNVLQSQGILPRIEYKVNLGTHQSPMLLLEDSQSHEGSGRLVQVGDEPSALSLTTANTIFAGTGPPGHLSNIPSPQWDLTAGTHLAARSHYLDWVNREEEENRRLCAEYRAELRRQEAKQGRSADLLARLDMRNSLDERRLRQEEENSRAMMEEYRLEKEEKKREKQQAHLSELWQDDSHFLRGLACSNVVMAAATAQYLNGIGPGIVLSALWEALRETCWASEVDSASDVFPRGATAVASGCNFEPGGIFNDGTRWEEVGDCSVDSGVEGGFLWRALTTMTSTVGTILFVGYETLSWTATQALSLANLEIPCEAWAVLFGIAWGLGLLISLSVAGWILGSSPLRTATLLSIMATWIWVKFKRLVVSASWQLLWLVPFPSLLLLLVGPALRYLESQLWPGGQWRWGRWDMRPLLMRLLPSMVSLTTSVVLGAQMSCQTLRWWCLSA
ncbi:unnamed protein product [Choristocarpus tenellus]